jgi:PadR family transcriptional regulator PadR
MKKYQLGEFEEIVILTIGILNNEAYSVAIKDEIDKGYLKSFGGEATNDRAGRPKRYFEITAMGKKAMLAAKASRDELWKAIPKTIFQINLAQ